VNDPLELSDATITMAPATAPRALSALLLASLLSTSSGQAGPWDAEMMLHSDATAARFNAFCLDGSRGAFYYRPASTPSAQSKWKFHFMGGGWATTPAQLLARSRTITGSSSQWTPWLSDCLSPVAGFYGAMSLNDTRDSIIGDFNFVWFGYCDGTSQLSDLSAPLVVNGTKLFLRGRALLDAHLAELDARFNFTATATEVIVSGTSAGGLSAHLHAPLFQARLPRARVTALPDASWWWDSVSYDGKSRPWLDSIGPALPLWNFSFNAANPAAAACRAAHAADPVKCVTQPYQHAFSTVPTFLSQSLYDTANLGYCYRMPCTLAGNADGSCSAAEVAAIQGFAGSLRASIEGALKPADGYFFLSCSQHETSCQVRLFCAP
jgi:hypothetical protein